MDNKTLEILAEFICGDKLEIAPQYRTGSELTRFFSNAGLHKHKHDGTTRKWWTLEVLKSLNHYELLLVIQRLASPREYGGDQKKVKLALESLNSILSTEGFKVAIEKGDSIVTNTSTLFELKDDESNKEQEVKEQPIPNFIGLNLEPGLGEVLENRWREVQLSMANNIFIGSIVLMGSLLEGVLLAVMQKYPSLINQSKSAPRNKNTEKVKHFADWNLSDMIDCAHEVGWLGLDISKFSHVLRSFRNYIHPYQQLSCGFTPDLDTCKISWLVVQTAVTQLTKKL